MANPVNVYVLRTHRTTVLGAYLLVSTPMKQIIYNIYIYNIPSSRPLLEIYIQIYLYSCVQKLKLPTFETSSGTSMAGQSVTDVKCEHLRLAQATPVVDSRLGHWRPQIQRVFELHQIVS